MTVTTTNPPIGFTSRLVSGLLAIEPLANFAKQRARQMMIDRAERIGVPWRQEAESLRAANLAAELAQIENPQLVYPDYYLCSFHAYEAGNLSWDAATEVEVAARAVHAGIWPEAGAEGDKWLRQSFLDIVRAQLPEAPQDVLDLGCSVGMSTFAIGQIYPNARYTGVDLSPYFLAVAQLRSKQKQAQLPHPVRWIHAAAEATGLPDASFDLVSLFLVCHELPQTATHQILQEARRVLRPNGHLAIMEMNPKSEVYAKMPPYVLTLLKSTEPYLDEYFTLDLAGAIEQAGFEPPMMKNNSPRHRTVIAKAA
jgi:ubiquinone/menaquinone biosynthesis C-methylase UbiE